MRPRKATTSRIPLDPGAWTVEDVLRPIVKRESGSGTVKASTCASARGPARGTSMRLRQAALTVSGRTPRRFAAPAELFVTFLRILPTRSAPRNGQVLLQQLPRAEITFANETHACRGARRDAFQVMNRSARTGVTFPRLPHPGFAFGGSCCPRTGARPCISQTATWSSDLGNVRSNRTACRPRHRQVSHRRRASA